MKLVRITEGHHYLRRTSGSKEREIERANVRAMDASGRPGYADLNKRRNELLAGIEKSRPLRRFEFIKLYGYQAWLEYVAKHGLSPDHKWADAELD